MTNSYKLKGTHCKFGAIGTPSEFVYEAFANTPLEAMNSIRETLYQEGYERILFKEAFVMSVEHKWEEIPMMEALGLE